MLGGGGALALVSSGKSCSSASGAGSSSVGSSAAATSSLRAFVAATSAASAPPSLTMPFERSLSTKIEGAGTLAIRPLLRLGAVGARVGRATFLLLLVEGVMTVSARPSEVRTSLLRAMLSRR